MKFSSQAIISSTAAFILFIYGDLGFTMLLVIGFCLVDLLTGLIAARQNDGIKSKKFSKTVWKIVGYGLALGLANIAFNVYPEELPKKLLSQEWQEWIGCIPHLLGAIIVTTEFLSNIENLIKAKILPENIIKILITIFFGKQEKVLEVLKELDITDEKNRPTKPVP